MVQYHKMIHQQSPAKLVNNTMIKSIRNATQSFQDVTSKLGVFVSCAKISISL